MATIRELEQRIERLVAELAAAREENLRLRDELKQARERIAELEQAAARQAAPFRRPERLKVPPEQQRRPGGRPGHEAHRRRRPSQIDFEIDVPLAACPHCRGPVSQCLPLMQVIEELPPVRPVVTRLTTWRGHCARCGWVESTHPLKTSRGQGVAGIQLGPRAQALATLLNKHLGLTAGATCQVLRQACGLRLSRGGLMQLLKRVAGRVGGEYERLVGQLRGSAAVFADETSWWVGGPKWWLWVFTTPDTTLYRVDQTRGSQVVKEVLGDDFAGMLVSDCLSTYDPPPYRKHKCLAHHLKALREAEEALARRGQQSQDLFLWKLHLQDVIATWQQREQLSAEQYAAKVAQLERGVDNLLARSPPEPEAVRFRDRLRRQRPHLLGCLYEPAAEPTNNRAERALRPAVIARKLSCGNKTSVGRDVWQILASLAATCTQRRQDFIDYLALRLPLAPQAG
jgi:hypothetical protein